MAGVGGILRRALTRSLLVAALVVASAATAGVVVAAPGGETRPVASFTAAPNPAQTGQTVSFNGEGSTDRGGTIVKYEWDLDGDGSFETDTGSTATTSKVYGDDGVVNVKLRVTDDDGFTSEAAVDVTITNRSPSASFSAGPNPALTGQDVAFDAGASQDPDGSIAKHEWDLDGNGSFETNSGADSTVSRAYSTNGTVSVKLRVTDDDGATAEHTLDVIINNRPPIATFSFQPENPVPQQPVTFDASRSIDPDGALAETDFRWDLDNDGAFDDASGRTPSRAFATAGTKTVKLSVTDSDGAVDIETRTLTVQAGTVTANARPRAAITYHPQAPQTGQGVALTSVSRDPDGPIAGYAWDLDNDGQFDDGNRVTVSHAFSTPGTHIVRLRVSDSKGALATTSAAITVVAPVQPAPTLVSPFPVVRIVGRLVRGGARIRRLSVRAPAETTITVRCRRRRCPYRKASAPARPGRSVRFRRLERRLPAGTLIEILVRHPTKIGKYTGFRIRRGRTPRRRDLCLAPGAKRGTECPSG